MKRLSSEQARTQWRQMLDTVVAGDPILVERYHQPTAVLLSYQEYLALQAAAATNRPADVHSPESDGAGMSQPSAVASRQAFVAEVKAAVLAELTGLPSLGNFPIWDTVPAEFQAALAAMDQLGDDALRKIAQAEQPALEMEPSQALLKSSSSEAISKAERMELAYIRTLAERIKLRREHAAALLRWRGHNPPSMIE